jgi:hypothetical protein
MSTLNKINWRDSNTTLTRENLAKMADDINVISQTSGGNVDHYLDTLGERTDKTIRNLQEGVCEKNTLVFDSNTAVLTNKLSTEVYTIDKENLCTKGGTSGSFANYFNPLPAGIYAMYLWIYDSTTAISKATITITARYNKKSKNVTDVDNRIMVVNKTVGPLQAFTFEAPNGIDFISITTSGSYKPVIVRVNSLTESIILTNRHHASKGTTNLMPFPFQYDYVKSGITSFDYNVDGFPCKGGLKFKHLTNGAL